MLPPLAAALTILSLFSSEYINHAVVNCLRLFRQTARFPLSLARLRAGNNTAISSAIMAMTTNSSISVNALRLVLGGPIEIHRQHPLIFIVTCSFGSADFSFVALSEVVIQIRRRGEPMACSQVYPSSRSASYRGPVCLHQWLVYRNTSLGH